MGWYGVEGASRQEAIQSLKDDYGYLHTQPGFYSDTNIWSITGPTSRRPGVITLDLLSWFEDPLAPRGGCFMVKECGPAPNAWDVPDDILLHASSVDGEGCLAPLYDPRAHDDRDYVLWLAKVAFLQSLLNGDQDMEGPAFDKHFEGFKWW